MSDLIPTVCDNCEWVFYLVLIGIVIIFIINVRDWGVVHGPHHRPNAPITNERTNRNSNILIPPWVPINDPSTTHLTCAICAANVRPSDVLCVTECGHMFHTYCMVTWLQQVENCPHCRNYCTIQSLVRLYLNFTSDCQNLMAAEEEIEELQTQLSDTQTQLQDREAQIEDFKREHDEAVKTIVELHEQLEQAHSILQVSMKLVSSKKKRHIHI